MERLVRQALNDRGLVEMWARAGGARVQGRDAAGISTDSRVLLIQSSDRPSGNDDESL